MKKPNKPFIIGIAVAFLVLVFASLFLIDIGINSKFFIEKDFKTAFEYLVTGDCKSFNNYLYKDGYEDWCEKLHDIDGAKIKSFEIQNLSHKFGSDNAFLNVELTVVSEGKEKTFIMNRQMQKVNFRWKIIQSKK